MMHFSERTPVVKRRMTVHSAERASSLEAAVRQKYDDYIQTEKMQE